MKALKSSGRANGAFYIIGVDFLLACILICVLASYTSQYAADARERNIQSAENLNRDSSQLYSALFGAQAHLLRTAAAYCGKGIPENDMLAYLLRTNVAGSAQHYQLIRSDFTGSCAYDSARVITVDYSAPEYAALQETLTAGGDTFGGDIFITPEFMDASNAQKSAAMCVRLPVIVGGAQQMQTLMSVISVSELKQGIELDSTVKGVSSALIEADGGYITGGKGFGGENFVDFIVGCNGYSESQRAQLETHIAEGSGSFYALGADGEEKLFSFCAFPEGKWLVVTLIPAAAFSHANVSFELSIIIAVFLCIMMAFNVAWLAMLTSRLRRSVENEKSANQAKSAFLSRMSHDMRTPLNSILNYSNFIAEAGSLDEAREYGSNISIAGQYLLMLINDTLGLSRIESGAVELKLEPYDYSGFESNMKAILGRRAEDKGVELKFIPPDSGVCAVMLDRLRVEQIVINLLNNGIKFTPPGGSVSLKTDVMEECPNVFTVRFQVRDTGIGMSREFVQNRLFTPFAQEKRLTGEPENSGTGLGLSITKSLVELMGGTISCESQQNAGSVFTVSLPHIRTATGVEKTAAQTPPNARVRLDGKLVLICEDNAMNRSIAVKLLKSAGCGVIETENGAAGVEEFKNSDAGSISAVLMDIRMPVMDGLEAARAIRALDRPDARSVPIIAMSANAFDEDIQASLDAGMQDHLAKPIETARFFRVLGEFTQPPESKRDTGGGA